VAATQLTVVGRAGYRLAVIRNDSRRVIVAWPSADGRSSRWPSAWMPPEARLQAALDAFG